MAKKNKFDPKNTHVDQLAIPRLSETAAEARRILHGKTSDEIRDAQETIDGWIDAYFETAFEDEVNRLRSLAEHGDEDAMAFFRLSATWSVTIGMITSTMSKNLTNHIVIGLISQTPKILLKVRPLIIA